MKDDKTDPRKHVRVYRWGLHCQFHASSEWCGGEPFENHCYKRDKSVDMFTCANDCEFFRPLCLKAKCPYCGYDEQTTTYMEMRGDEPTVYGGDCLNCGQKWQFTETPEREKEDEKLWAEHKELMRSYGRDEYGWLLPEEREKRLRQYMEEK